MIVQHPLYRLLGVRRLTVNSGHVECHAVWTTLPIQETPAEKQHLHSYFKISLKPSLPNALLSSLLCHCSSMVSYEPYIVHSPCPSFLDFGSLAVTKNLRYIIDLLLWRKLPLPLSQGQLQRGRHSKSTFLVENSKSHAL